MLRWMREHRVALLVSCGMFAVMATLMGEAIMADAWGEFLRMDDNLDLAAWIWRIGGAVTWPVFMRLLLSPHRGHGADDRQVMGIACVVAAAYGGFGLWAAYHLFELLATAVEEGMSIVAPVVALAGIVLPFLYVWGFVGLYGHARARLECREGDFGWLGLSALATVVGVYGIGALIYLAMAAVALPIALVVSSLLAVGLEDAAAHVAVDMFAIAISTGNFASQWWAFMKVDEYFEQAAQVAVPSAVPSQPVAPLQPVAPSQPAVPLQPAVPSQPTSASQPMLPTGQVPLPRLFCTCGQELTLDQSQLPRYVARETFCPRCGARIAH